MTIIESNFQFIPANYFNYFSNVLKKVRNIILRNLLGYDSHLADIHMKLYLPIYHLQIQLPQSI